METIGQRIAMARKEKKYSQFTLGKLINVAQVRISTIENGGALPSERTIQAIAKALGVKAAWIRYGDLNNKDDRVEVIEKRFNILLELIGISHDLFNKVIVSEETIKTLQETNKNKKISELTLTVKKLIASANSRKPGRPIK